MEITRGQSWPSVIATVVAAAFLYGFMRLFQHRRAYKDLPKPPHHFLWGHLKLMGETFALFPGNPHFQVVITTLQRKYNLPGLWYLDLWPIGPTQMIVTDPDLALYVTVHKNHPKHPAEAIFVDPVVGNNNIVTVDGPRWKHLHNMLAPAFGVSRVRDMLPMVAEEVMAYREALKKFAQSGEIFSLAKTTNNLTFDIIGKAIFGFSMGAQSNGNALMIFEEICHAFSIERDSWDPIKRYFARQKRLAVIKRMDLILEGMVRERFEAVRRENLDVSKKIGLSIMSYVIASIVSANLTLLLGGSGTTTDTVCFTFMLLSVHPEIVQKLREEHDRVFTPGIEASYAMLCEQPNKINELEYTTNVIKETLRLYPIGNTARGADSTGFVAYEGVQYPTKDQMICPVQFAMQHDPRIFPNPEKYDPDRFTRDESPRHAWRPFERGPRACLGQSLAMDEIRTILLLTVRDFDFKCANLKPNKVQRVPWTDIDLTFGDRGFQEFVFEARPRDGMPMIVSSASTANGL
ncbi:cytochrome P450 [Lophiotrema nucula]|uniref:Cytochrome P450 n=1 Tax=Lophiotrema nucula TaxID=690887 RepID=A0A6A5YTV8_9PLEO|nr:cytochrome P450 [Lophiotrema nucula]